MQLVKDGAIQQRSFETLGGRLPSSSLTLVIKTLVLQLGREGGCDKAII